MLQQTSFLLTVKCIGEWLFPLFMIYLCSQLVQSWGVRCSNLWYVELLHSEKGIDEISVHCHREGHLYARSSASQWTESGWRLLFEMPDEKQSGCEDNTVNYTAKPDELTERFCGVRHLPPDISQPRTCVCLHALDNWHGLWLCQTLL